MAPENKGKHLNRIIVALDASPASMAALEFAAELAARNNAELIGIFVEDINLIRVGQLLLSKEIGRFTASPRSLESGDIERELRLHARIVELAMASVAEKANLRWSFRNLRGVIHSELLSASQESDLIIFGKTGHSGRRKAGSTARQLITHSDIHSLILRHRLHPNSSVLLIYDGSEASERGLLTARLISTPETQIRILLITPEKFQSLEFQNHILSLHDEVLSAAVFQHIESLDQVDLVHIARIQKCGVIVIPAETGSMPPSNLVELIDNADCAVLLIR
jgi:nucleotide-binding universal stress UspA family protein